MSVEVLLSLQDLRCPCPLFAWMFSDFSLYASVSSLGDLSALFTHFLHLHECEFQDLCKRMTKLDLILQTGIELTPVSAHKGQISLSDYHML